MQKTFKQYEIPSDDLLENRLILDFRIIMEKLGHEMTYQDFLHYPVWCKDPDTDLFLPTIDLKKEVVSIEDFYFKAKFKTPKGHELLGWVCGEADRLIVIDTGKEQYFLNKLLRDDCLGDVSRISRDIPTFNLLKPRDMFPLKFRTEINLAPFIDWEGEFRL